MCYHSTTFPVVLHFITIGNSLKIYKLNTIMYVLIIAGPRYCVQTKYPNESGRKAEYTLANYLVILIIHYKRQ